MTCETKASTCGVGPEAAASPHEIKCGCGGGCGGDPVVCAMLAWKEAFFTAKHEVMVDVLKAKIQKAWGTKLDKMADAVLEAMETKKESMIAVGKAKADLKAKIESIIKKG